MCWDSVYLFSQKSGDKVSLQPNPQIKLSLGLLLLFLAELQRSLFGEFGSCAPVSFPFHSP